MPHRLSVTATAAALGLLALATARAAEMALPPLRPQPTPQAVVDEHVDALNHCDWNRLMAQYPDDVQIHLPDGVVMVGREAVGKLFAGFCKPHDQGGLNGLHFTAEKSFAVDGTLNVEWRAEAPFLAEPYHGSDAYVTRGGLMAAQVSTFSGAGLKMK